MENENITESNAEAKPKKNKRYFWVKLMEIFFTDKYIVFLKQHPDGYRIICIYLMLQLKAIHTDGVIEYEGLLSDYVSEIAVSIGEPVDVVKTALDILEKFGFIEILVDNSVQMVEKPHIIDYGDETESASRMRKHRERKNGRTVTM